MKETGRRNGVMGYVAGGLSLAAPVLLIVSYLSLLGPSLFLLIGALSILSIHLQERYQYIAIAFIYLPALYALYLLLSMSTPSILIELAAGYFIALPILIVISYIKSSTLTSLFSNYVAIYLSSIFMRDLLLRSEGKATLIFLKLFSRIISGGGGSGLSLIGGGEPLGILFPPLVAISAIGFVYYIAERLGEARGTAFKNIYLRSLIASLILVGTIVAYSSLFSDAVIAGTLLSAALLALVSLRSRR